jgi:hypothetical protein
LEAQRELLGRMQDWVLGAGAADTYRRSFGARESHA